MDDEYQPIGIGLYLAASVFDHSCNPNAAVVFKGKGKVIMTGLPNRDTYQDIYGCMRIYRYLNTKTFYFRTDCSLHWT